MASFVDPASTSSASQRADESDLDPAAFLKTVRELSEKREREDNERYRALEAEIEQSRRDRAARREERARSISPQKAATPTAAALTASAAGSVRTPKRASPSASSSTPINSTTHASPPEVPEFKGFGSSRQSKMTTPSALPATNPSEMSESTTKTPSSATSLARSGTLSWQQRPSSRGAASRPRSMVVVDSASFARSTPTNEPEVSRDQIAASLGARDPSWFRQTADRGVGNAAFRKNTDENTTENSFASGRRGLPGMQRELPSATNTATSPPPAESVVSDTPSYTSYTASSSGFSTMRTSTSSKADLKALIAEDEGQAKAFPVAEHAASVTNRREAADLSRTPTTSSSQARFASATERPPSPTKGMGGFVQSAMLKRSDSVTKRWSAQPGASLARQDSTSASRGELASSYSVPKLESSASRSEVTAKSSLSSNNLPNLGSGDAQPSEGPTSFHSRSRSAVSTTDDGLTSPPSPSKRWSPTKSTWLESAISRPESPKPSAARNSQPSWMTDIAKAKAQRATVGEGPPKPLEESNSRTGSPVKQVLSQNTLSHSGSRDLVSSPQTTPKPAEQQTFASISPSRSDLDRGTVQSADLPPDSKPSPAVPSSRTLTDTRPTIETSTAKSKPDAPPKPQTDFRATLRPRPQPEAKQSETPEFLAKFGALRKTTTQNYVAPDVLKDNILRGKADLAKSGGPVKTERKDELKESLLAKKEQWKKDKDEGVVHERKVTQPPVTPQKPEALAKREILGKGEVGKTASLNLGKPANAMPEALVAQKSVREKAMTDSSLPGLQKQTSAPMPPPSDRVSFQPKKQNSTPVTSPTAPTAQPTETSRIAARFNPGLAGILARGPPASTNGSNTSLRSSDSADMLMSSTPRATAPSEPPAEGGQLQDMRKGRAKGPKKRKGPTKETDSEAGTAALAPQESKSTGRDSLVDASAPTSEPTMATVAALRAKPQALPGSAASIMRTSLQQPSTPERTRRVSGPRPMIGSPSTPKPSVFTQNAGLPSTAPSSMAAPPSNLTKPKTEPVNNAASTPTSNIPDFRGFGSTKPATTTMRLIDDDKENAGDGSPSVKSAATKWGSQAPAQTMEPPAPIKLPSKKDEDAAMRSAGLLASSSSRPGSSSGTVQTPPLSAGAPPKPVKSSRAVSGQLQEASPTKGTLGWFDAPKTAVPLPQELRQTFGTIPKSLEPLSIDTQGVINNNPHQDRIFKTIRKAVQVLLPDNTVKELPHEQEYTFFDESVYIFTHAYNVSDGAKKTEMFLWAGDSCSKAATEQAETAAKKLSKDVGNVYVHAISQGLEPPGFLQALGGILVTRQGSHQSAPKRYMLRGRKHLGQIVFDEVDFEVQSLQSGFAYLISFPTTLTETRLYLWKGSASSPEEVSAARLAAADLSESNEVIEVDDGAEFASFLKIFGTGTTKADIERPGELWLQKALSPDTFTTRLFGIQPGEAKAGLFSNIFTRRPSWGNLSPARKEEPLAKIIAREISPFTQSDLEADRIYLLDGYSAVYVLVGPVFSTQSEAVRNLLLGQTLRFASEYAVLAASHGDRPSVPKGHVILSGVPEDVKILFRHWDKQAGLWGTGGLLAGAEATRRHELKMLDLKEVLDVVCDV